MINAQDDELILFDTFGFNEVEDGLHNTSSDIKSVEDSVTIGKTDNDTFQKHEVLQEEMDAYITTVVFDSIKTTELFPLMKFSPLKYPRGEKILIKMPSLSEYCKSQQMKDVLKRRVVYRMSLDAPELIDYCDLKEYDGTLDHIEIKDREMRISGLEPMGEIPELGDLKKYMRKKENSPWAFYGSLGIQFSQYYVTDNWYKGGTPNATFLTIFDYNIDYRKEKWFWENDFDVKIGFYNTSEDTIRAFRVNNDVFKISTLLGYQTTFSKKVFYSAAIDFSTSLFTGYKTTNSNEVVSAFLSPTRVVFSLGMESRYNQKTTVRIAPVAYKLIFITDDRIDPLVIGIDSTSKHVSFPGFLVQGKLDWKFSRSINLTSKIDFFSTYNCRHLEFEWEVIGKFIINRYLSTRLSLVMRYDNTPKNERAQIQVQEQLSFGFNYVFR